MQSQSNSAKHIPAFDGLKLIFILIVIFHHSAYAKAFLFHGYMSVDLFFMISGYMLMQTIRKKPELSITAYFRRRVRSLYPHYFFSFILLFCAYSMLNPDQINLKHFLRGITEMLMIQNLGPFWGGINYPCWYMSVLLFASLLAFFLWKHIHHKLFYTLSILCALLTYGYILFSNHGNLELWNTVLVFHLPFWRGVSGILTGMLIYGIQRRSNYQKYRFLFYCLELASLSSIFALMCIPQNLDALTLIAIILLLISIGNPSSVISRLSACSVVSKGIHYEYAMFLNHALIINVLRIPFSLFRIPNSIALLLTPIAILVYSVFTTHLVNYTAKLLSRKKPPQISDPV